jgi:hypothetical protein
MNARGACEGPLLIDFRRAVHQATHQLPYVPSLRCRLDGGGQVGVIVLLSFSRECSKTWYSVVKAKTLCVLVVYVVCVDHVCVWSGGCVE